MISLFSFFYNLLWALVAPFLFVFSRYGCGWKERLVMGTPKGPYDFWIQASSGGEAYLALEFVKELALLENDRKIRVLVSSGTPQGMNVIQKGIEKLDFDKNISVDYVYFPLDAPLVIKMALKRYSPKKIIIVETELWPSLLIESTKRSIPVFLINGRMSEKSYRSYSKLRSFFATYAPKEIYGISREDVERFASVCKNSNVEEMNNIKFDRLSSKVSLHNRKGIDNLFQEGSKVIVLGSVRRQEEAQIIDIVEQLLATGNFSIAIFPKHESRAKKLAQCLEEKGLKPVLRSEASSNHSLIVWDSFGELTEAYHDADAVFVGGSLQNLGGQNFLEPMSAGIRPIIGPFYDNFRWVGEEVFQYDLLHQAGNAQEVAEALIQESQSTNREAFTTRFAEYLEQKQGGTAFVVKRILFFAS